MLPWIHIHTVHISSFSPGPHLKYRPVPKKSRQPRVAECIMRRERPIRKQQWFTPPEGDYFLLSIYTWFLFIILSYFNLLFIFLSFIFSVFVPFRRPRSISLLIALSPSSQSCPSIHPSRSRVVQGGSNSSSSVAEVSYPNSLRSVPPSIASRTPGR